MTVNIYICSNHSVLTKVDPRLEQLAMVTYKLIAPTVIATFVYLKIYAFRRELGRENIFVIMDKTQPDMFKVGSCECHRWQQQQQQQQQQVEKAKYPMIKWRRSPKGVVKVSGMLLLMLCTVVMAVLATKLAKSRDNFSLPDSVAHIILHLLVKPAGSIAFLSVFLMQSRGLKR